MNKKGIIIITSVAFVFLLLVGGGFYMMWMKIASLEPPEEIAEEGLEEDVETPVIGEMFPLDTFVVNLADAKGKRYLKATMQLELAPEQGVETFEQRLPQIRDVVLTILPTKKFQEIRSIDGKTTLRAEIMNKLNELFKAESVTNIYFTEFVIQ